METAQSLALAARQRLTLVAAQDADMDQTEPQAQVVGAQQEQMEPLEL